MRQHTRTAAFLALATSILLGGCAETPVATAITRAYNLGQELPKDMVGQHFAGYVGFDETYPANLNKAARGSLYGQGLERDTPEYRMRTVRINISNTEPGLLWMAQGDLTFMTGAFVPDHLPQLRAWDIVEVRQSGTWNTMKGFAQTGEGNIVVRILCRKSDPDWEACRARAPRTGKHMGTGPTGTPYPASVREYGYTFTPIFDGEGRLLRAYPKDGR